VTLNTGDNKPLQKGILEITMRRHVKHLKHELIHRFKDNEGTYAFHMKTASRMNYVLVVKNSMLHDGKVSVQSHLPRYAEKHDAPIIMAWTIHEPPRYYWFEPSDLLEYCTQAHLNPRLGDWMVNFPLKLGRRWEAV
jgi:hypothetical protein